MRIPSRALGAAGAAVLFLLACSSKELPSTDSPGSSVDGGGGGAIANLDVPVDDDVVALGLEPDEFIGDDVDEITDAIMELDGMSIGSVDVAGGTDPDGTPIPVEEETGDLIDHSLWKTARWTIRRSWRRSPRRRSTRAGRGGSGGRGARLVRSVDRARPSDANPSSSGESTSSPTVDRSKNLASTCRRMAGSTTPMKNYGKCLSDKGEFTKTGCCCFGSEFNCMLPNPQPGRNRYLPNWYARYVVEQLRATPAAKRREVNERLTSRHRAWLLTPRRPSTTAREAAVDAVDAHGPHQLRPAPR